MKNATNGVSVFTMTCDLDGEVIPMRVVVRPLEEDEKPDDIAVVEVQLLQDNAWMVVEGEDRGHGPPMDDLYEVALHRAIMVLSQETHKLIEVPGED